MCFDWLPGLVRLEDSDGDPVRYLDEVYSYFHSDFVVSKPAFGGKRFALKRHPELYGKEATFWHVTSEGKDESKRTPDMRRCERIRWLRPMIEAVKMGLVKCWRNTRVAGEERIIIALNDFSFVIVLADRGEYVLLWTAFCVEYESRREALRQECEEYEAAQKADAAP